MSLVRCNDKEEADTPSNSSLKEVRKRGWGKKSDPARVTSCGEREDSQVRPPGWGLHKRSHPPSPSRAVPPGGVGPRSPDTRTLEHSAPTPAQFLFQSPGARVKLCIPNQPTDDPGALISSGPFNLCPGGRRKTGQNGGRAASRPQKRRLGTQRLVTR